MKQSRSYRARLLPQALVHNIHASTSLTLYLALLLYIFTAGFLVRALPMFC